MTKRRFDVPVRIEANDTSYAYTMVGNNLSGRYSRGALACVPGTVLARTAWY